MAVRYTITTIAGKYADRWIVKREDDGRIMTEGSVFYCLNWVKANE